MKLLPLLLLTLVLTLGVACSSEPAPDIEATVEASVATAVAKTQQTPVTAGEALTLIQGMLRTHPIAGCRKLAEKEFTVRNMPHGLSWLVVTKREAGGWHGGNKGPKSC